MVAMEFAVDGGCNFPMNCFLMDFHNRRLVPFVSPVFVEFVGSEFPSWTLQIVFKN